jgi:hypothetical protein
MPYNPITDLALNCAARDKYEVEIEYMGDVINITCQDALEVVKHKEDIPRVVCECILKSENKL